jgi:hypothetical protein
MLLRTQVDVFGLNLGPILAVLPMLLLAPGCEEERAVSSKPKAKSQTQAEAQPKPAVPKAQFIVGQRTQDIKNASIEVQKGGANVVTPKITAKDPITLQGNAYVSIIGQTSILSIQHAMDLYHAMNDRYPKDYDEFITEIIKANSIALPQLPFYQKYGYDEKEHKLVILEYPELKAQPLPQ